ncbi:CHC2 zinc finger domain-containing protein [Bacillus massilinigeriensis]|uniref:CHC2 zinc finger domain-containing protein n=1 Tax=Bacillus massilionigeriensis TaxID=1805475 RepID=UPI00096AE2E4|nr:CHC2 zinc finger domain-containing protein [Bacillus massilionigeriensis]
MSVIELIKDTISIVDALEQYTGIIINCNKVNRKQFNIRCPFHNDKNPSFTVYTQTNTFRCWAGCNDGNSGDVIDLVRLSTGEDTKGAIKILTADFGLKNPSSAQSREWQKKKVIREQSKAIQKGLDKKVNNTMFILKKIEKEVMTTLSTIKTIEDLDRSGDLYHVLVQIEYWLDCLVESDPVIQIQTLEEVNHFLSKVGMKAG